MKQTQKHASRNHPKTPEQREERKALGYAVAIHAALFIFMLFGLVASPQSPNPVQVELWTDGTTPTAAEPQTEPEVADEPTPEPEPEPEPQPEPPPETAVEPPPPPPPPTQPSQTPTPAPEHEPVPDIDP